MNYSSFWLLCLLLSYSYCIAKICASLFFFTICYTKLNYIKFYSTIENNFYIIFIVNDPSEILTFGLKYHEVFSYFCPNLVNPNVDLKEIKI